jgi:methionyl-tRNA formyltransferase
MSNSGDASISVLFFGTPHFSVPTLDALTRQPGIRVGAVITQPDKASGRGGEIQLSPIKKRALELGIPVFQPKSIRKEFSSLKESLATLGPFDVGVVIAFGQILPEEVLHFPAHGCINIHASLLPRWRGAAPIHRAIEAGDRETGVCLMKMDIGLDTGAVYSSIVAPITDADTTSTLHDRLSHEGSLLITRDLPAIISGSLEAVPQPSEGITYAHKITTAECKIDWTKSAEDISRAIRAFSPHPGSFTGWQGKRLKVLQAHATTSESPTPPGTVLPSPAGHLLINCGASTALYLDEVQLEGKKRMLAADFLRGISIPTGSALEM